MSCNHFILQEDPRGGSQSKKPSTTRSLLFKNKYGNRRDGPVHIKNTKWMATFWYQRKIRYNRCFLQTTSWNSSQFLPLRIRFTKWLNTLIKGTIIPTKYNTHVRHHMIHGFRHLQVIKKKHKTTIGKKPTGLINQQDGARVYFKICQFIYFKQKRDQQDGFRMRAACVCFRSRKEEEVS